MSRRLQKAWLLILCVGILSACGSSNPKNDAFSLTEIEQQLNEKQLSITKEWMMPLGMQQIQLLGYPNFIALSATHVEIYLPYVGERQIGSHYTNSEGGIRFQGTPEHWQLVTNEQKGKLEIQFQGKHNTELLQFFMEVFPNGRITTRVNSTERNAISYRGFFEFSEKGVTQE